MSDAPLGTTVSRTGPPALAGRGRSRLHLVHPPALATAYDLGEAPLTIGRQAGPGALAIDEGTVSRRHALIEWDRARGAHVALDLESRNGTSVDGVSARERCLLLDGSVLRVGDALLVYERDLAPDQPDDPNVAPDAVPGQAAVMRLLRAELARAAADPAPVLIVGPSGAGKERIAGEVHRLSGRAGPLIAINCAALSKELVESQLFGHVKGAFTGAASAQPGLFRAADGGTLFLDEIGEMPLELQAKLLRAIQEGEVQPVGSTQLVHVDVRIVAATNRELDAAIAAGSFRHDLYARLALWQLRVPPLYQRRVDLFPWIARLQAAWAVQRGRAPSPVSFDADAAETLLRAPWPTNLRGLERLIHELGARSKAVITRADLPEWVAPPPSPSAAAAPARPPAPTREAFLAAHAAHAGSVRALAKHFGRDRKQIYRWMQAFGVARSGDEPDAPDD